MHIFITLLTLSAVLTTDSAVGLAATTTSVSPNPPNAADYTLSQDIETAEFTAQKAQATQDQIFEHMDQLGMTIIDPALNLVSLDESHEEDFAKDMVGYVNVIKRGFDRLAGKESAAPSNLHSVRNGSMIDAEPQPGVLKTHKGKEAFSQAADSIFSESVEEIPNYYSDPHFATDQHEPDIFHVPTVEVHRQWREALIMPHRASVAHRESAKVCFSCSTDSNIAYHRS